MKNLLKILIIILQLAMVYASSQEIFLENGIGIKSLGMGQAYFNLYSVESPYYNPAQITYIENSQIQTAFNKKFGVLDEVYFAYVYPNNIANLGLYYFNSGLSNGILGTSYDPQSQTAAFTGRSYSYFNSLFMLSTGKAINDSLAMGVNFKYIIKNLEVINAGSFGIDLGCDYKINSNLNYSLKINNIYSTGYEWSTEVEKPNPEILTGFGLKYDNYKINLGLLASNGEFNPVAGFEGNIANTFMYRAGVNNNMLCAGFGLKFNDIGFDYAYNYYFKGDDLLESVHRFGLSYTFGSTSTTDASPAADTLPNLPSANLETKTVNLNEKISLPAKPAEENKFFLNCEFSFADKIVIKGLTNNSAGLQLNQDKIKLRPDGKFYQKIPLNNLTHLKIYNKDDEMLYVKVKITQLSDSIINISGENQIKNTVLTVNKTRIMVDENGKFNQKIAVDKTNASLRISVY